MWGAKNRVPPANRVFLRPDPSFDTPQVDRAYESTLAFGVEYERRALALAFASEDAREGPQAFLEKRKPEFKAR